jgi:hypothetical protein
MWKLKEVKVSKCGKSKMETPERRRTQIKTSLFVCLLPLKIILPVFNTVVKGC